MLRTHIAGKLSAKDKDQTVVLAGWVQGDEIMAVLPLLIARFKWQCSSCY